MLNRNILVVIVGIAASAVAGGIAITAYSQNPPTHSARSQPEMLASVWDRQTESYSGNVNMTVYRSPSCGCCGGWIEHAEKHGFQVNDIQTDDLQAVKQEHNITPELASCHTAIVDGYVFEGHIPAGDIKQFLKEKPNVAGLTVPAMPLGTPGMEAGDRKEPFDVLAFDENGQVEVFNTYDNY